MFYTDISKLVGQEIIISNIEYASFFRNNFVLPVDSSDV